MNKHFLEKKKVAIILSIILFVAIIIVLIVFQAEDDKQKAASINYESVISYDDKDYTVNPEVEAPSPIETSADGSGTYFENKARGYRLRVPKGYEIYESSGNVYVRDSNTRTQVAIISVPGNFTDGIEVYESSVDKIYRLTALLEGENGVVEEKGLKNYGTKPKATKQVGTFEVKTEEAEVWWRNTGDAENIILPSCDYFTTWNGKGLVLMGLSQTMESGEVFNLMDSILSSFEAIEVPEEQVDMATFEAETPDGTSFVYPADWKVTQNEDGMVAISAGNSETNPYAGMVIEAFADVNHDYVEDYAQFSGNYEAQLIAPTFTQTVSRDGFSSENSVLNMDFDQTMDGKECILFEVQTKIIPKSTSTRNSLGINGDTLYSYRYTYKSGITDCVLNFIIPPDNEAATEMMEKILSSVSVR